MSNQISLDSIKELVGLYNETARISRKANNLLEQASNLEEKIFGASRNDTDRDELIDRLEYSSGYKEDFTVEEVCEIWGIDLKSLTP